jgi:hypothetical protein
MVKPGKIILERPTLICLGFQWPIEGDTNRNAAVDVAWRKKGSMEWRDFHPAMRIGGEVSGRGTVNPPMFAGSIIDLKPGTAYEVKLTMRDPDGVSGQAEHLLAMTTRAVPAAAKNGKQLHVYAPGHQGDRTAPSFDNVQAAYDAAQPGDIILVHAGNHQKDLVMNKAATEDRPIVIRGAGDGEARIQGQGNDIVNVNGARHHIFEDLTFYDADNAFLARGETHALTVRRCRFHDVKLPLFAISARNRDFLICDNDMVGPVKDWHPRVEQKSQGVWISGQGHAVCFNRITKYWDGLSITGAYSPDPEKRNSSIDFYNNDLSEFLDDGIELDYGTHNIRVFRNFIRSTFMGISTQPVEGGPGYIFRNVVYANTRSPLKLNQMPSGLLIFHNTFVSDGPAGHFQSGFQNSLIYNNLFVGKGSDHVIAGGTTTPTTRIDFNGYRFWEPENANKSWRIHWQRVHPGFTPSGGGLNDSFSARSLDEFAQLSHLRFERHGFADIDYTDFANCPPPRPTENQHDTSPIDLHLVEGSRALDRGIVLPYFSDGYQGKAPDLGAYERGALPPHYGPRNTAGSDGDAGVR